MKIREGYGKSTVRLIWPSVIQPNILELMLSGEVLFY
jgi:hypothetical protein